MMSTLSEKNANKSVVLRVITPVMRNLALLLLKSGINPADFAQIVRQAFVWAAQQVLRETDPIASTNKSRIATMTGYTREVVTEILAAPSQLKARSTGRQRSEQVLMAWFRDPRFTGSTGSPRALSLYGKKNSFEALVRLVGGDLRVKGIAEDLVRTGAAVWTSQGMIKAVRRTYVIPKWGEDSIEAFGEQIAEHTHTLLHNLNATDTPCPVHRLTNPSIRPNLARIAKGNVARVIEIFAEVLDRTLNDPKYSVEPSTHDSPASKLSVTIYVSEAGPFVDSGAMPIDDSSSD